MSSLSDWAVPWTPVLWFSEWCHLVRIILFLPLSCFHTHNTTTSQCHNVITPQPHNVAMPQCHYTTTPQHHNTTTPQCHNPTTPQPHNPTVPKPHNTTTPLCHNVPLNPTVPECQNNTILERHNTYLTNGSGLPKPYFAPLACTVSIRNVGYYSYHSSVIFY